MEYKQQPTSPFKIILGVISLAGFVWQGVSMFSSDVKSSQSNDPYHENTAQFDQIFETMAKFALYESNQDVARWDKTLLKKLSITKPSTDSLIELDSATTFLLPRKCLMQQFEFEKRFALRDTNATVVSVHRMLRKNGFESALTTAKAEKNPTVTKTDTLADKKSIFYNIKNRGREFKGIARFSGDWMIAVESNRLSPELLASQADLYVNCIGTKK